jgi:hypothetical protein
MTTLDDLVREVEQHPTNPIIAAMLTDELMAVKDMTRSEADAKVASVQTAGGMASLIRAATALLADATASRTHLLAQVYRVCRVPRRHYPTVIVSAGDALFISDQAYVPDRDDYWGHVVILVGARWLLSQWDAHRTHVRTLRAARRRRRSAG